MTLTYHELTKFYMNQTDLANQPHAYIDFDGVCRHCQRNERNHDLQQERVRDKLRATLTRPQEK